MLRTVIFTAALLCAGSAFAADAPAPTAKPMTVEQERDYWKARAAAAESQRDRANSDFQNYIADAYARQQVAAQTPPAAPQK